MEILNEHEHLTTYTSADLAASRRVFARRVLFAALVLPTIAALLALTGYTLSAGGLSVADGVLLLFFGLTMPWAVIGFWNGVIGLFVMRLTRDPVAAVNPSAAICISAPRTNPSGLPAPSTRRTAIGGLSIFSIMRRMWSATSTSSSMTSLACRPLRAWPHTP